ncbi:hypothetical protein Taro_017083 [Colocasia esculenta]|uniref:Uncharacterized protein n=1 Tax=Colocasia esculenta TaxID=4460 RepID=A0A843US59_COLES|nr:hypothetical protein [Colocasia esculenta]
MFIKEFPDVFGSASPWNVSVMRLIQLSPAHWDVSATAALALLRTGAARKEKHDDVLLPPLGRAMAAAISARGGEEKAGRRKRPGAVAGMQSKGES